MESTDVSTKQRQIAELARIHPEVSFTSLAHHIDLRWLYEAFQRTRKDAAVGVDGQTAEEYAKNLGGNLRNLLERAKAGTYFAPPVRRVYIPKGTGTETRPIGIPCVMTSVPETPEPSCAVAFAVTVPFATAVRTPAVEMVATPVPFTSLQVTALLVAFAGFTAACICRVPLLVVIVVAPLAPVTVMLATRTVFVDPPPPLLAGPPPALAGLHPVKTINSETIAIKNERHATNLNEGWSMLASCKATLSAP